MAHVVNSNGKFHPWAIPYQLNTCTFEGYNSCYGGSYQAFTKDMIVHSPFAQAKLFLVTEEENELQLTHFIK